MEYGVLSLVPPIVMLFFALKTKKYFEALIFGTLVGYIIMHGTGFLIPWCNMLLEECGNRDNLYILMLCGMFGSLACFYSDATVLSGKTCDIDNLSHAVTQLPYALTGATVATLAFVNMRYNYNR